MLDRSDAGKERGRKGGRDAGQEGCRTGWIQDRRDAGHGTQNKRDSRQEGDRKGGFRI